MKVEIFYEQWIKNSVSVSIDSRKIKQGDIFIALKGDNFNGNEYALKAIEQGASCAIVDEKKYENLDKNIFYTPNALLFLQELATYHREQLGIKIISLTGSNGKTTTKELISSSLLKKFNVAFTQGNLNNHIGVPLTLLSITRQHDLAVVEMGANHPKEIKELCEIARPNFGYITNFGKAHLEGFGSEEGIVKAKSELYDYLRESGGVAFVNNDDEKQIINSKGIERITFAFDKEADYNFKRILNTGKAGVIYKDTSIQSELVGDYNQNNIATAISIALYFGVDIKEIKEAIEGYVSKINRSQTIYKGDKMIIMDAYNANPSSMEVAVKHFSNYEGTKAVILGDMFELGAYANQEHSKIISLVKGLGFNEIFLLGNNFYTCGKEEKAVKVFKNKEEFQSFVKEHPITSQSVLIKGSRGMRLEEIEIS